MQTYIAFMGVLAAIAFAEGYMMSTGSYYPCGSKPSFNETLAAQQKPLSYPATDANLQATAKTRVVCNLSMDSTNQVVTDCKVTDVFASIGVGIKNSSGPLEQPESACMPHVLAIWARPAVVNYLDHPAMLHAAFMAGPEDYNGTDSNDPFARLRRARILRANCSAANNGVGAYTMDDELLAVLPLSNLGNVTLVVQVDPLNLLNDPNPCNNYIVVNATFNCSALQRSAVNRARYLYNLQPNQAPAIKSCNYTGRSVVYTAMLKQGGDVEWMHITNEKLMYEDYMKFVLGYEIQEFLRGATCTVCDGQTDTCGAANATNTETSADTVDISKLQQLADIFKSNLAMMMNNGLDLEGDYNYNQMYMYYNDNGTQKESYPSRAINTTVDRFFKKLMQVLTTKACPFSNDVLVKMSVSRHEQCQATHPGFLSYMIPGEIKMPLGDLYEGLKISRPDKRLSVNQMCMARNETLALQPPRPSCHVNNMRALLRLNDKLRQRLFRQANMEALSHMVPGALVDRIIEQFMAMGIDSWTLMNSTLGNALRMINSTCTAVRPSFPECGSQDFFFHVADNQVSCGVLNPNDTTKVCWSECAVFSCPMCWEHEGSVQHLFPGAIPGNCTWQDVSNHTLPLHCMSAVFGGALGVYNDGHYMNSDPYFPGLQDHFDARMNDMDTRFGDLMNRINQLEMMVQKLQSAMGTTSTMTSSFIGRRKRSTTSRHVTFTQLQQRIRAAFA